MIAASEETRLVDAGLLIGAGILACQVGKAFIAMPVIIADLDMASALVP